MFTRSHVSRSSHGPAELCITLIITIFTSSPSQPSSLITQPLPTFAVHLRTLHPSHSRCCQPSSLRRLQPSSSLLASSRSALYKSEATSSIAESSLLAATLHASKADFHSAKALLPRGKSSKLSKRTVSSSYSKSASLKVMSKLPTLSK